MAIDDRGLALMGASGRAVERGGRLLTGQSRRDHEREGNDVWPVLLSPVEPRDRTEPGEVSLDVLDCTPDRADLVNCFRPARVGRLKKTTERPWRVVVPVPFSAEPDPFGVLNPLLDFAHFHETRTV
ncbi:hypothetical protein [Amycolatopsis sp. lyj-90]|uniref:hypothetical protein n=1 Tax=Amycolatopsis sp. lyj-90 TaxID=2789285 RepID=UPI0039791B07